MTSVRLPIPLWEADCSPHERPPVCRAGSSNSMIKANAAARLGARAFVGPKA
jgi:hypothetical protein